MNDACIRGLDCVLMNSESLLVCKRGFVLNVSIKPWRNVENEACRDRGFGTGGNGKFSGRMKVISGRVRGGKSG